MNENLVVSDQEAIQQEDHEEAELSPLDAWLKRISEEDMPVFDRTARSVTGVTWKENSNAGHLAQAILHDPAFTAKVLRMANSVFFNPGRKSVNSISRAVVVLGFNSIRSICLTVAVLDSLKDGAHAKKVLYETAHCYHAAVQAKNIALRCKKGRPEEIYVAALLKRIGELAFWCHAGQLGNELNEALARGAGKSGRVEQRVLGFQLKQLTLGLCKEWNLGELLYRTLVETRADNKDPNIQMIHAGHDIAEVAVNGWEQAATRQRLNAIAKQFKIPADEFNEMVIRSAMEAADAVETAGGGKVSALIPQPRDQAKRRKQNKNAKPSAPDPFIEPDPKLQSEIMLEIDKLLSQSFDINNLLGIINEGIYRAIGMDRVFFGLMTPDRKQLKAKHNIGWSRSGDSQLVIPLPRGKAGTDTAFNRVIAEGKPDWISSGAQDALAKSLSQGAGFFLAPVSAGTDVVGLFYADRQPSDRLLDQDAYRQFIRMTARATEGFTLVRSLVG